MNPLYREDAQRLQINVHPDPHNFSNTTVGDASRSNNAWDSYSCKLNVDWEGLSPSSHNFCNAQPQVEDPDGEPLEINEEDPELTRKRKELREIEEQILQKRVSLALKTVQPILMKTTPGYSCNEHSAASKGETLRDRVKVILQQRHSLSFLKVQSPKEGTNFPGLHKDGLLHKDHPLKLRVKSLMKQRYRDPCVLPSAMEVANAKLPLPSQNSCSPAKEENGADKGFQRFLSVLNKGVDMDLLSRIVNDDSDDLPLGAGMLSIQLPAVKSKSDLSLRSENQQSNSGVFMPGPSQTSSGDGKAEQQSGERSNNETNSLPDDLEKNDRGYGSFGSSSRSKSPPTAKKKNTTKKEEEKPKVDEQREQLENILKTLGLDLEVEEMSKLADRTQERLYGKKHEGKHSADGRGEHRSRPRASHRHYSNSSSSSFSSSSSSSSSTSRSTSRSPSPSPSRHRHSHSRDSKQGQTPERRQSRGGSRERSEGPNVNKKDHQHAPFSSFPDYTLSQFSQCTAYSSDNYSASTDSYWTYTQGAIPPSIFPHPQSSYHQFPGSAAPPNMAYPHHKNLEDISFFLNPDLSTSEGQIGSASGLRCLQVVSTKEASPKKFIKQLTKSRKRGGKQKSYLRRRRWRMEKRKEEKKKKKQEQMVVIQRSLVSVKQLPPVKQVEQPEDEKRELTEKEIKANLRKKLEAFNQKAKQQVARPVAQPDDPCIG
ncbi:hypothetical protein Q5P01_026066 [Channa striata]|uniref:Uncharacterized protein n=1 Tax=Channa striata TaxID=64152 RepID=A0AA88ITX5_CHASR|nr:hypothetical protein Q5P01_026066 [Channa striata]